MRIYNDNLMVKRHPLYEMHLAVKQLLSIFIGGEKMQSWRGHMT